MEPTMGAHAEELRCGCKDCRRPFAYVQNGALLITSRHGGDSHTNTFALLDLARRYLSAADLRYLLAQHEELSDGRPVA